MELPGVGKRCAFPECRQLDFLPFTCNACHQDFCLDHRQYDAHRCTSERPKDVRAAVCPVCGKSVQYLAGEDPNTLIDTHMRSRACSKKSTTGYECSLPSCSKREVTQVKCGYCKKNFCLQHRFEQDHDCPVWLKEQKKARKGTGMMSMLKRDKGKRPDNCLIQ